MTKKLESELETFSMKINRLPDIKEPPHSILEILSFDHLEKYWNRLLTYFLDPKKPHGFETRVLECFLETLSSETDLEFTRSQLQELTVKSEVSTSEGNQADLIIHPEDYEWFVWTELKVRSSEGENQTYRYVEDEEVGNLSKEEAFGNNGYYVYIAKKDDHSQAEEFQDIPWTEFVRNFEQLLTEQFGEKPLRSHSQFGQFLETIKEETGMKNDPYKENQKQKRDLYLEYSDEIDEARRAFKKFWETHRDNWNENFEESVNPDYLNEDEWLTNSNKYGQFYRRGWYLDENLKPANHSATEFRLHFVHMIRNFSSFQDGNLVLKLKSPTKNNFREKFSDNLSEVFNRSETQETFETHGITDVMNNAVKTEKNYEYSKSDLPDSYYQTLDEAMREHFNIVEFIEEALEKTKEHFEDNSMKIQ